MKLIRREPGTWTWGGMGWAKVPPWNTFDEHPKLLSVKSN